MNNLRDAVDDSFVCGTLNSKIYPELRYPSGLEIPVCDCSMVFMVYFLRVLVNVV